MGAHDLDGKTVLLTGATKGIGLVAAREIARTGAALVLVARDAARGQATVEDVRVETGNDRVELITADLSVQAEVRRAAAEFRARHQRLDVLVNNAGAIFAARETTADGLEATFALNHLSYFLLTSLLLDLLKASAPARVVSVASGAHHSGHVDFDDLGRARGYSPIGAYGQSKLCNVLFTYELARRLEGTRVTANCLHPGFVRTGFGHNRPGLLSLAVYVGSLFAISPEAGARTTVFLATDPSVEGTSGKYFYKCRPARSSRESHDPAVARRLWEESERLVAGGA